MSSLKDTGSFCCVASWSSARQAAWKARDTSCACDPHTEYCAKCIPQAHRPGGAWDQCKPSPSAFADLIAERDDLAKQRGDLAARVLGLQRGRHPTLAECETAGRGPRNYPGKVFEVGGLPDTPEERARFEAYMRGHCWEVGAYDEALGAYDSATVRCFYGVWRDRGALPTVTVASDSQPSEKTR